MTNKTEQKIIQSRFDEALKKAAVKKGMSIEEMHQINTTFKEASTNIQ